MDEIPQIFKDELSGLLGRINDLHRPRAEAALNRIAYTTTTAIASGNVQNLRQMIAFDLSSLASLTSASISETEAAVKVAMSKAFAKAISMALDAVL